jgi:signal transduction histidine kinase
VDVGGRSLAVESYNEVSKMLYRLKDFEQVYNISENKFRPNPQEFSIRSSIEDVVEIAQNDLQSKNVELSMNHGSDIPISVKGDSFKFKQILLNLLLQSISGTLRGIVKIKSELTFFAG